MDKIKIQVSGNAAEVTERPKIVTSGTVGLPVKFSFDSRWEGLTKLAVFSAGSASRTVDINQDAVAVPWEVLKEPNLWLRVGVYGINADGSLAIPTLYADVCVILPGADPDTDPSMDPTLPVWQETAARLDALEQTVNPKTIVDTYNPWDYTELLTAHFPIADFYWHKYLDGTAEVYYMAQFPAEYGGTALVTFPNITLPFALKDYSINIANYVEDERSTVACTSYTEDVFGRGINEFSVSVIFDNPDGMDPGLSAIVDFEITITGRWK